MRWRACVRLTLFARRPPAGSPSPRGASTFGENAPWGLSADRAERFGRKAADTDATIIANATRDGLDTCSVPLSPEFQADRVSSYVLRNAICKREGASLAQANSSVDSAALNKTAARAGG